MSRKPYTRPRHRAIRAGLLCAAALTISAGAGLGATVFPSALAQAADTPISHHVEDGNDGHPESDGVIVGFKEKASDKIVSCSSIDSDGYTLDTGKKDETDVVDDASIGIDLDDSDIEVDSLAKSDDTVRAVVSSDAMSDKELADEMESLDDVAFVMPNYVVSTGSTEDTNGFNTSAPLVDAVEGNEWNQSVSTLSTMTNDPYTQISVDVPLGSNPSQEEVQASINQWYLYNTKVPEAWDKAKVNDTQTVAVLDSGCQIDHEDLKNNIIQNEAWSVGDNMSLSDVYKTFGTYDLQDHGTHVAGIVAAEANNGFAFAGASYNAKILPIKLDVYTKTGGQLKYDLRVSNIMDGLEYLYKLIDEGKVSDITTINMSLGVYLSNPDDIETFQSTAPGSFRSLIQKGVNDYGITFVGAGGNGDPDTHEPYSTGNSFPADYDEVICVTSIDSDNTNTYWSDYNMDKDISAPGTNIWSTVEGYSEDRLAQMVGRKDGTSMASPLVAGIVSLMKAACPDATPAQIRQAIVDTAIEIVDPENDRRTTSGSAGRIDANAAIDRLKEITAEPEPEPAKPSMASALMTVDKMSVAPGDTVKVTSTYTLDSSAAADITDIKNTLKLDSGSPTGIAFQTGTLIVKVGGTAVSGAKMASDGTITGIGNVAAGQSISVTYDVKIGDASSPSALDGKKLTISSSVTAANLTGTTTASTSAISIKAPVVETPSLSMSVSSSSSSVEQGTDVPVTITLRNANSKASVGSIKFTDNVTGGATVKQSSVKVSIGGTDVTSACDITAAGSSLTISIDGMDVGDTELTITYSIDTSAASGTVSNKPQFTVTGSDVATSGQGGISVTVNEPEPEPGGNENENKNENQGGGQQGGGNQNQNDNKNENENQGGGTTQPGGGSGNENQGGGKPSGGNQNQNDNKNQGGSQGGGSTTGNDSKNSCGSSTTNPGDGSSTSNDNSNANRNGSTHAPTSTGDNTSSDGGNDNSTDNGTSANGGSVADGNSNGGTTTLTSDVNGGGTTAGGTLTDDGVSNDATGTSGDGSYDAGSGTPVDTDDIVQTGAAPMIGAGIAGIGAGIAAVILSLRDRFKGRK